jgi:TIGR03009 family protein
VLVLGVLLSAGAAASAQNTPAPKSTPNPNAAKLDEYLAKWEKKMLEVKTLNAELNRLDKDKVFNKTTKYAGSAQYLRSGEGQSALNLATLELKLEGKTEVAEKMVCTGTFLYVFAPPQKEIRAYELPKGKTDSFLDLLFGMKAEEIKKTYTLTLAKEDQWYVYVDVVPKEAKDKKDFARARLVLWNGQQKEKAYLPRQLWFEHANGNEVTWDVPKVQTGVELSRRLFDKPATPNGWKLVPMTQEKPAQQQKPSVVRPAAPKQ